ncbi:hypothetical protein D9M68_858430 [compost metagenome]
MARRRHGDDRVVEEGQELQGHVRWHQRHDQQVVAVGAEAFDCLGVIDHHQLQADFRVFMAKSGEQVGNEVLGAGFHGQAQLTLQ